MAINFNKVEFILSAASEKQFVRDGMPQLAFAGRSNVGKSSVINRLVNRKNFARVGASPGKTSQINYFKIDGKLYLVDLPGYGYAKVSKKELGRWSELIEGYFNQDRNFALVVSLIDIRHEPSALDRHMVGFLIEAGFPFAIALTKADKLSKQQANKQRAMIERELALPEGTPVVLTSSAKGTGVDELRKLITRYVEG